MKISKEVTSLNVDPHIYKEIWDGDSLTIDDVIDYS